MADRRLGAAIDREAQKGSPYVVTMSTLTTFPWERLFVFLPYTTAGMIEKELGFSWSGAGGIEMGDSFTLLVFVNNKKVVRFVEKARGSGDFVSAHKDGGYSRDEAVFQCKNDASGWLVCAVIH